jgi:hypothetical protein
MQELGEPRREIGLVVARLREQVTVLAGLAPHDRREPDRGITVARRDRGE